jgi:hypothetical protein
MMLVLICMVIATILAIAFLAGQSNSTTISANVSNQAEARWLAQSGLEIGIAVLETDSGWRTGHNEGTILNDFALGNGTIQLQFMDLVTQAPPTESTTELAIRAVGRIGSIEQESLATAHVPLMSAPTTVDVDLSEFAAFTRESLTMWSDSTITRWTTAPANVTGPPLAIGTRSIAANSIMLHDDAAAVDTTVYHGPAASTNLIGGSSTNSVNVHALGNDVPLPDPPVPVTITRTDNPNTLQAAGTTINKDTVYHRIIAKTGQNALTIMGNTVVVTEESFEVDANAGVVVDGNVTLIVLGDLKLANKAQIVLTEGSTLTAFVFGPITAKDNYIGPNSVSVRDSSGNAEYIDPESVRLYSIIERLKSDGDSESAGTPTWSIDEGTVIIGTLYAPNVHVQVRTGSAIYGNIVARKISMESAAALFYDHALDLGYGFTNASSPIFNTDGTIIADVLALNDLSDATLAALANALGGQVISNGETYGTSPTDADDSPLAAGSTPRTVVVEFSFESFGTATSPWEGSAAIAYDLFNIVGQAPQLGNTAPTPPPVESGDLATASPQLTP